MTPADPNRTDPRLQGEAGVVQELAQEVFLKCLQHCQRFEEGRPVAAWLFTLAANAATDHLRRRGREVSPPETFDAPDPHQASPWESVDQGRRIQALRGALDGLTPRQRAMRWARASSRPALSWAIQYSGDSVSGGDPEVSAGRGVAALMPWGSWPAG